MSVALHIAAQRSIDALRSIAADLDRGPNPQEDMQEYERQVANKLRKIANDLADELAALNSKEGK